jgi:hypothetical protein
MNDQLVTPGGNPAEGKCRRPLMGKPTKDGRLSIRFQHRTGPRIQQHRQFYCQQPLQAQSPADPCRTRHRRRRTSDG